MGLAIGQALGAPGYVPQVKNMPLYTLGGEDEARQVEALPPWTLGEEPGRHLYNADRFCYRLPVRRRPRAR